MSHKNSAAALLAAVLLAAVLSGCSSDRTEGGASSSAEVSSSAETEAAETEIGTETTAEVTTTVTETEVIETETTAAPERAPEASNITLTHITEGGEGLGAFNEFSGNIRGEVMQQGSEYKGWKLDSVSGHAEPDDTIDKAAATFTYGSGEGFSVNGTVEVLPADDPDYPNKMYFHSDDVDAFPRYMYDNRGDAYRAKYIIENSSDVYMLLDKDNPPQETSFAVSVTVDSVTVRYSADGHAYDTIHVKAASNR